MDNQPSSSGRESFLTIFLVVVFGGAFVYFLNFISLGIFSFVLMVIVGITLIGSNHYVLWGHGLSNEVAGEREELELREGMDAEKENSQESY